MSAYLPDRGVANVEGAAVMRPLASTYWVSIARPSLSKSLPDPISQEVRTLTTAMDFLAQGAIAEAADMLMSRFNAVET